MNKTIRHFFFRPTVFLFIFFMCILSSSPHFVSIIFCSLTTDECVFFFISFQIGLIERIRNSANGNRFAFILEKTDFVISEMNIYLSLLCERLCCVRAGVSVREHRVFALIMIESFANCRWQFPFRFNFQLERKLFLCIFVSQFFCANK